MRYRAALARAVIGVAITIMLIFGWQKVLAAPCPKAQPVTEGAAAPCDGILVPTVDAKRALACLLVDLPDCAARAELAAQQCSIDKTELTKQRDAHQRRADALDQRLAEVSLVPETPWHEQPWFVATASVLASGVVALAVWGIVEAAE